MDSLLEANSSSLEKSEVDRKGVGQPEVEHAAESVLKRHRLRHAGEDEEMVDSGASSHVRDVQPLAQRSAPSSTHQSGFGGPRFDDDLSSDEDEQR